MKRHIFFFAPSLVFAAIISFLFLTEAVWAQSAFSDNLFLVTLKPNLPGPLTEVTAEVISNGVNLNSLEITWILNGKESLRGIGKKSFTFTTGEVGSVTALRADINTNEYGLLSKNIDIQPTDADILWEADTYTPPFYKGKALPSSQSYIKAVALPHFITKSGKVKAEDLVYMWKKSYTPNPNDSGRGKNVYLYRGTYTFNTNTIETIISTPDNTLSLNKKTRVYIHEPKIVFYEDRPLEGVRYEELLPGSFNMKTQEVALQAAPYFFSFQNTDDNGAIFTWRVDGKRHDVNTEKKSKFVLRKPDAGKGTASVVLEISNRGYDLQKASKNISLSY